MMAGTDLLHSPAPAFSALPRLPTSIRPSLFFLTGRSFTTPARPRGLRSSSNPNFKILRANASGGIVIGCTTDSLSRTGESDLPVELCQTRTLPPALTLEGAALQIKEAIEELKLNPPCSSSGVLRFQVAVPESVKALNWLFYQPQSLEAFPQFYLSGDQLEKSTCGTVPLDGIRGVSGVGSAVHFTGSSYTMKRRDSIKRYLSVDSPLIRAFGFVGANYNSDSSSMKNESGSFYFFIPQIELDEFENNSLLAATLVWDESFSTFKKAVDSFELAFRQAIHHVWPTRENFHDKRISNVLEKSDLDVQNIRMFDSPLGTGHLLKKCANINAVWAALIIEECTRLGLTYFCIAPGSRSSALAVAASTHPHTTCISCYDERSLAFHAVGYARGSNKPAVVITSSGTAVSNLLPAVVEASQDFVPLLLLTADRPPELLDAGANQAINQVNHYGSFVRHFFSLPPPSDNIPARMVLTTVDSAVYKATQTPCGPVHINCSFREPLEASPRDWALNCLKGLDLWMSKREPFTEYIKLQNFYASSDIDGQVKDILDVIKNASQGLLVVGAIHTEEEMWSAFLLAKHLFWPVVADILSGLRLRKVLTLFPEVEKNFLFLDHLDHALLSESVRSWTKPDVVLQIGSRITSKRISQMLEGCSPCSYIMVDKHPYRHDPSHIVTHRLQSTITDFADYLLKFNFPRNISRWHTFLQALNMMVGSEISFQIHSRRSLTEPYVAQVIAEMLHSNTALFIGNSMVIRDADTYGRGWMNPTTDISHTMLSWGVPCCGIQVAGNRGASGIDGLISTAIGFAVGCEKRVLCVIGDISFLHDTNGLAILRQRTSRKPMTILVTNNQGGAIFSLLPIADRTHSSILQQYFYTSHNVSISKLCEAHSVKHLQVRTKAELNHALWMSQHSQIDYIIEVESSIEENAAFHRLLTKSARQAADHALKTLSRFSISDHVSGGSSLCKIHGMEYSSYRIQQCAPRTSTPLNSDSDSFYRDGFVLTLSLEDGSVGFGEVAPIEIHKEDLVDVEEQLRFLTHMVQGAEISYHLPLLRGSFSSWIWRSLGIPPSSIFPSVRCGLEMAILNALAARQGSSLSGVILGCASLSLGTPSIEGDEIVKRAPRVQICALLDSSGTPEEVAHLAAKLVDEGFTTIKLKVARRANPVDDAAVVHKIREKVGYHIKLRVDANRNWTYEEAVLFGSHVKCYDLQYIEEPVHCEDDIIKFCEETGLCVALDETIDSMQGDPLDKLMAFVHPRIVAVIIKPSVVGGFENAALVAKWAQQHEKMAVISGAYESSLSLSSYVQFAYYLEEQNIEICKLKNKELCPAIVHGLGTYRWLKEDVATEPLKIGVYPPGETVEASVEDAALLLKNFQINPDIVQKTYIKEQVWTYQWTVDCEDFSCSFNVRDVGRSNNNSKIVVFLHGFLGTGEDWVPIMKSLSANTRCISIDLPGHGKSNIKRRADIEAKQEWSISIEVVTEMLSKLIHDITPGRVVLVGYSLGARIALYMTLRCSEKIDGAVIISGSPGLEDGPQRNTRTSQDDSRAQYLTAHGLQCFLDTWYSGKLWNSLRGHPHFEQMIRSRMQHDDVHSLAKVLSGLSPGRQPSLWEDLKTCKKPLLFVCGEKDRKFKEIARQMWSEFYPGLETGGEQGEQTHKMMEIPDCGHVVHLENPLPVINAVRKFLSRME